ncbi:hypothetical protein BH09ACT8_BH09ACT8_57890 [soil metagenome]
MPGNASPVPTFVEVANEVGYYLSLSVSIAIGLTVAALAIPEAHGGVVARRVRALAMPVAVFVAVVAVLRFFGTAADTAHVGFLHAFSGEVILAALASPPSRGSALGSGVAALIALMLFAVVVVGLTSMRRSASRWLAGGVTAVATVAALVPTIPASLSPISASARNLLTAVHVLGALFWVGGLVVLATAGMMGRRDKSDDLYVARAAADWNQIWERYSVVALYAVGALIVSGTWLAWSHVGSPVQLFTTSYGRYLAVKLLLVIALLVAGAYNMRVVMPKIRAAEHDHDIRRMFHLAVEHFPVVVVAESVVAFGILVIVPFLRGSARSEAGEASAGPFDLTVFGTGVALVALTAVALWAGTRTPTKVR